MRLGSSTQKALLVLLCLSTIVLFSSTSFCGDLNRFLNLEGTINIAGGTAHIPVMREAARRIMSFNPKIRITIAGGGSGVGVQKVGRGLVDIGNTGRPLSQKEITRYGLETFPFAIDGVTVVVHPSNPVSGLSSKQVREIFAGHIRNWEKVGGKDEIIDLYGRDEASGTRAVFWKKLLKKGPIDEKTNIVASNGAMKVAISRDENAIGYISIGHVDKTVKAIRLDGVKPTQENAVKGKYKIVRKLYMNTKGKPNKLVKAFIDYIRSPEGAEIIKKYGFVPLR